MEIPMTTAVGNGSRSSSRVRMMQPLMPDSRSGRAGSNGVLSRCRDRVAIRDVAVFLACRHCHCSDSRGTSAAGMEGSRPGARQTSGSRRRREEEQSGAEAETNETEAAENAGRRRGAGSARAKPRRHILPRAALTFLLLTLAACRPCHGHDPELSDMDDEDGKFYQEDMFLSRQSTLKALSLYIDIYIVSLCIYFPCSSVLGRIRQRQLTFNYSSP